MFGLAMKNQAIFKCNIMKGDDIDKKTRLLNHSLSSLRSILQGREPCWLKHHKGHRRGFYGTLRIIINRFFFES